MTLPIKPPLPPMEALLVSEIPEGDNWEVELSPKTKSVALAREWLSTSGIKLDGIIAKRLDLPYRSGERDGMQKVKRMHTADCVVGGFRYATKGKVVGSLRVNGNLCKRSS